MGAETGSEEDAMETALPEQAGDGHHGPCQGHS